MKTISGFSKLNKDQKIDWLLSQLPKSNLKSCDFKNFWHSDIECQKVMDDFSENTISNFILPFGLAPNFIINDKNYTVPMVIEESSVVAAASKAAKFWSTRGGFTSQVISSVKKGQVHFSFNGKSDEIHKIFLDNKDLLISQTKTLTLNMEKRGGGLIDISLVDKSQELENYFQIDASFETCDAMGANFINSVLENLGKSLKEISEDKIEIIMCILSNYTPECLVETSVSCPIAELGFESKELGFKFARKFKQAIDISRIDSSRAVTHNKGIFNGIDAVVIASGNDFRATSACAHAYAAKDGVYRGLSRCSLEDDIFHFSLTVPLSIGTVGGLTSLHPMAKKSLEILGNPQAKDLMMIIASTGLAQNFAAIKSLVTTGIQKGHMKMHLLNILNQLNANELQIEAAKEYFENKVISFSEVRSFIERVYH